NRQRIHDAFPQSDVLVNMLVVHTVIMFASTNSWVIARLGIYTDLYVAMLIPMMVISCFRKENRSMAIAFLLLFFMAYHLYENRDLAYYSIILDIYM
ncbi:MAG: EpsG family protein, partial [Clostridia bacterium]|nr:EpsG family protein [Clostridia bacterium]